MRGRWEGGEAQALTQLTLETYGTVCHLCGKPGATTADHVIPRSRGGLDEIDNLRPAHKSCNSSRGNMLLAEWFDKHPMFKSTSNPSRNW